MPSPAGTFVLTATLSIAVPLRIHELQQLDGETRTRQARVWADAAGDAVAHQGDILQYGGTRGEAAGVFNHLARGLAALACAPGGVVFAGMHWCIEHPIGIGCASSTDLACRAGGCEPISSWASVVTVQPRGDLL